MSAGYFREQPARQVEEHTRAEHLAQLEADLGLLKRRGEDGPDRWGPCVKNVDTGRAHLVLEGRPLRKLLRSSLGVGNSITWATKKP